MHGLRTLAFLHEQQAATQAFNTRTRANDPGGLAQRRAEEAIEEGRSLLEELARDLGFNAVVSVTVANEAPESERRPAPQEWSVAQVEDDYWVLPLTLNAAQVANALFPTRTRRYGMHYICDNPETRAIAVSLLTARED